jgi:hypothetical protein
MRPVTAAESATFFEYGSVELGDIDRRTRQATAVVRMPFILMQSVTPALLGGGSVAGLALREPLAVWIPSLGPGRMNAFGAQVQSGHDLVNRALRDRAEEAMRLFGGLSHFLTDPADAIPVLPMGTYVTFTYRFRVDDVLRVIEAMEPHGATAGVPEFQAALASVLHEALSLFGPPVLP